MPLPLIPLMVRGAGSGVTSPGWQSIIQIMRPGGVTGPQTSLTAATATGVVPATPASMFGIRTGMQLWIGRGTANIELITVGSVTATTFTPSGGGFTKTHAKGDTIDGAVSGSQNFLRDITPIVTQCTWNDLQQGGLEQASVQLLNPYVNIGNIVAGNWLLAGFLGGNLATAISANATTLTLTGFTDDLGNSYLQAGDVVMISDGSNTDLMTVASAFVVGTTLSVALNAAPGQPNAATLNGYAAGTKVARLCYQGIITSRPRTTRYDNQFIITANGFFMRYGAALGNVDVVKQDAGYAMYGILANFASSLPEIIIGSGNFVGSLPNHTTGVIATSQGTDIALSQTISDLLRQENVGASGAVYAGYVDQTRQFFHRQIPTTTFGSAPTWVADIYSGGTGAISADVIDTITTTDMDITGLVNAVIVTGGTPVGGKVQLRIIVQELDSIAANGFWEGTLQNTNITDQDSLAGWAASQLKILAYPVINAQADFVVSSLRITARDLIKITGFDDSSTMTINPVQVQYRIDAKAKTATAQLTLGQLASNAGSVMAEIAAEVAYRNSQQQPNNNLIGTFVVSGFDLSTGVGPATEFTISAGVVCVGGVLYSVPALTDDIRNYLTNGGNGISFGVNPGGPSIVQMPTLQSLSGLSAQYTYTISGGVLTPGPGLNGLTLWRITALSDGTFFGTKDLRYWGGVNNNNAPPAGTTMAGTVLGSVVLAAEGLASVSASVPVTLPAGIANATWLREVSILTAIAGSGAWSVRNTISAPTSSSQTFLIHGLAAGQSYDVGIMAVALNGQMTAVQLLGTSPTISAAAISATLLTYNEFSPQGVLNTDGSIKSFDGQVGQTVFHNVAAGDEFHLIATIAAGSTATITTLFLSSDGTENNGYGLILDNTNSARIFKKVAGVFTTLATLSSFTYDTNPHVYRVTVIVGSTNKIEASFDSHKDTIVTDSSLSISTAYWLNRGGGLAGTIRNFSFAGGPLQQPTSGGLVAQGSIPPIGGMPQVSWTQTAGAGPSTDSITFTTPVTTVPLGSGQTLSLPALNQTITGLTNSVNPSPTHTYYWDIAFDIPSNSWVVTHGAVDTHRTASEQIGDCYADGRVACAIDFGIATLVGGGSGGGGSGGGSCPAVDQLIETLERGLIPAGELEVGQHLRDPDNGGWNEIEDVVVLPTIVWEIETPEETIRVNRTHAVKGVRGWWRDVESLQPGDLLKRYPSGEMPVVATREVGRGLFASITCERHQYVLGKSFGHNNTNPGQCPAVHQQVETRELGFIRADRLIVGLHLRDPIEGWNAITRVETHGCDLYRIVTNFEEVDVNDTHMVLRTDGAWVLVYELKEGDLIEAPRGQEASIVRAVQYLGPGKFVSIACERNRYVLGQAFAHNVTF